MRILYHHRTASRDGQEVHIRELVGALRALGHEVLVVAPGGEPDDSRADGSRPATRSSAAAGSMGGTRGGLGRLRALVPDALLPLANRAYSALFVRRLLVAARDFRPDVMYERHALDNRVGSEVARRLRIPLLLEVNAPLAREQFEQGKLSALERALRNEMAIVAGASAVLAVTTVLKEILVADGVPEKIVHVIQNGASRALLDTPRDRSFRAKRNAGDALVLGFVGFPRPWHGLDRVIRAMAERGGEPGRALARARFWIAGEGPAVAELSRLAGELGVAERVELLGVLGRDEVVPFLDAIDVALQPAATRYASPLKLFEYLARGVPVIAPRQPNIEEIVVDGRSAILFDPDRRDDFLRRLEELSGDPSLRDRIGRGGRARIDEAGYTWARNAERVAAIAAACVAGSPA